jgi:hypothetical protein
VPSVTLSELMDRAREHADQEDSTFVTDTTLKRWLNKSLDALYGKTVVLWEDYYLARLDTSLTGDSYALPSDFFKLVNLKVRSQAGPFRQLLRCTAAEEDYYLSATGLRPEEVRYRVEGARTVRLFPGYGAAAVDAKLAYVPLRTQLVEDSDAFDAPQGWEEWAVLDTAIRMVTKAEQDTAGLLRLLGAEEARFEREAPKRDQNSTARVQDVTTMVGMQPGDPNWWAR